MLTVQFRTGERAVKPCGYRAFNIVDEKSLCKTLILAFNEGSK